MPLSSMIDFGHLLDLVNVANALSDNFSTCRSRLFCALCATFRLISNTSLSPWIRKRLYIQATQFLLSIHNWPHITFAFNFYFYW